MGMHINPQISLLRRPFYIMGCLLFCLILLRLGQVESASELDSEEEIAFLPQVINASLSENEPSPPLYETEPNDTRQTATIVDDFSKTYQGYHGYGDRDYFRLNIETAGKLNITLDIDESRFSFPNSDDFHTNAVQLVFYDESLKRIIPLIGVPSFSIEDLRLTSETYYILVYTAADVHGGDPYSLSLSFEPDTDMVTPTPIVEPSIACAGDDEIVNAIIPQFAAPDSYTFFNSSNTEFGCAGVFDSLGVNQPDKPALSLSYNASPSSFADFSIVVNENTGGFDLSSYDQVCYRYYVEVADQIFEIKLKNTDGVENGVSLNAHEVGRWEKDCIPLIGFPDVYNGGAGALEVLTLNFNNSFGPARVWVDDFEFK
ncbi:MAG: hypothetical protein AAGD96_13940 [Chloroflexota bacterium]